LGERERRQAAALEVVEAERDYLTLSRLHELERSERSRAAKAEAKLRLELAEGLAAQVALGVVRD